MRRRLGGWRAAALLLLAGAAPLPGCVDTELGLDAQIDAASVAVASGVVSVSIDVTYRVGEHAEGARQFQPQAIELYVDGAPVAELVPSAPPGFDPVVAPGESAQATLEAGMSGIDGPTRLCGAEVTVLFRWFDATAREIGMVDAVTRDVTCE